MEKVVGLKELIDEVTDVIKHKLNYVCSDGSVDRFKSYFEDNVIGETITCSNYGIKVYGTHKGVSNDIKSALIASNIKRDGRFVHNEQVDDMYVKIDYSNLYFAKKKAQENEETYLGFPFGRKVAQVGAKVGSHNEVIMPSDFVKIGTSMNDRESGYVEDHSGLNDSYINLCKMVWSDEKSKYIGNGLTNTLYFKVLQDLFENDPQHHYPLITRHTLERVADFAYKVDNDIYVSDEDLSEIYRLNDASKIVDKDIVGKYEKDFNQYIRKLSKKEKVKQKTKKL